ncbi:DUF4405 domain-containing protein [Roseateles sp. BYS78W]|uniref:DUF4405 domain-containing protein n=1 Tax=Pelomonas candidula TaxID=3299025 RepID=A0ABW7HJV0_9BURK
MTRQHHPRAHPHPAHPPRHRLPRWQRRVLYGSGVPLLLTGLVWLAVHYSVGAGAGELPHPLEAWCLRLHGLAAMGALFVLGALAAAHMPQGWRLSRRWQLLRQQRTGVALCGLAALLVLSGYLLYYFAPEDLRPALGGLHAAAGVAMAALVLWHRRGSDPAGIAAS